MTKFKQTLAMLSAALLIMAGWAQPLRAQQGSGSYAAGRRWANWFSFGYDRVPGAFITSGNSSTGSQTITVCAAQVALPDGRTVNILGGRAGIAPVPLTIDPQNSAVTETVTPTVVSLISPPNGVNMNQAFQCANVTATFSFLHGSSNNSKQVISGDFGLQEAINDAQINGGGIVVVDGSWLGTSATIAAATEYVGVSIEDLRFGTPQYWNSTQTASTFLAVPSTLTATTVGFGLNGANTTGGTYTGTSTYHVCIAYVDVNGQEGACSSDFSGLTAGTGSTNQIGFAAPAASAGAVGYTVYISLASGTYSLAYQAPLTSTTCKLTTVETITPACAVTNTTYNQTGSNAVISALTLATSPVDMQLGGVSGTLLTGNPNGRTTYGYVSGSHVGGAGFPTPALAFTAGGIGSATPISIGTVNFNGGILNLVGKTIRICGKYLNTDVNSSTQIISVYYDAAGSNSAGSPVKLSALTATGTGTAAAYEGSFCENFITTVSGAGATAGSILPGNGNLNYALVSTGNIVGNGSDTQAAAVGSINLAGGGGFSNRLSIIHNNATGNATPTLQSLSIEVL